MNSVQDTALIRIRPWSQPVRCIRAICKRPSVIWQGLIHWDIEAFRFGVWDAEKKYVVLVDRYVLNNFEILQQNHEKYIFTVCFLFVHAVYIRYRGLEAVFQHQKWSSVVTWGVIDPYTVRIIHTSILSSSQIVILIVRIGHVNSAIFLQHEFILKMHIILS